MCIRSESSPKGVALLQTAFCRSIFSEGGIPSQAHLCQSHLLSSLHFAFIGPSVARYLVNLESLSQRGVGGWTGKGGEEPSPISSCTSSLSKLKHYRSLHLFKLSGSCTTITFISNVLTSGNSSILVSFSSRWEKPAPREAIHNWHFTLYNKSSLVGSTREVS